MVFPDAKDIQAHLVSERNRFKQFGEMFCGVDCPARGTVNGCGDETVYANFHMFLLLTQPLSWDALLQDSGERRADA